MLDEKFVLLAAALIFIGDFSYLIQTVKGRIQPNKVTWLLWAAAPLVAFAAERKEGVGIESLLTFSVGFFPLLVFFSSFLNKKAQWKIGKIDIICGILSVLGILLWYFTRVGNIAIFFRIMADGLAALPTIVKAYRFPETEDYKVYLLTFIASVITLLTLKNWNFENWGFPVYILIVDAVLFVLIKFKLGERYTR